MTKDSDSPVITSILNERSQSHETRRSLYEKLEKHWGRPVVSFFTSFVHRGVLVQDHDADMLEGLLRKMDLSKGLALIVNSPGGLGLAAERIVNVCQRWSARGDYWAVVPGKAKSAATMI